MRGIVIAVLAALVLATVPATAQQPPSGCRQQCVATDPDVNNPSLRRQGPVNVILYGHMEDLLNQAPLTTLPPDRVFEPDLNSGFIMPVVRTKTGLCQAGTCFDLNFKQNVFDFYSCWGGIEFLPKGWRYGCHSHEALREMVLSGGDIPAYLYLSADAAPAGTAAPPTGVGAMPQVGLFAEMRAGHRPDGAVLASSPAPGIPPSGERVNLVSSPGGEAVYELRTVMRTTTKTISAENLTQSFHVFMSPYQIHSQPALFEAMQTGWRLRTGANFPPRIILPTENVLEPALTRIELANETLHVTAQIHSLMGGPDVDPASVRLTIAGPGSISPSRIKIVEMKDDKYDHWGQTIPLALRFAIDLQDFSLPAGTYTVNLTAQNRQGTFEASDSMDFVLPEFTGSATAAGPGPLALLAVVLAACAGSFAVRRRRQS